MNNDFKNQIDEIYVELKKGTYLRDFFKSYFSITIIPKPKTIAEEFEIINALLKYDISSLNLVLQELEIYRYRNEIKMFPQIGILPLILILSLVGIYCKIHGVSEQIFFGICTVAIVSEFFSLRNSLLKLKNNKYIFLLKQAILLKGEK